MSVIEMTRALKIQLITFFTLMLITNKKRLDILIWVIVFSIGFFGFKGGIFTIASAGSFRVWGPPDSFIEGNNELALALLMIVPLMWYLRQQSTNIWLKRFLLLAIVLLFQLLALILEEHLWLQPLLWGCFGLKVKINLL